jgi:hypothetical protein
MMKKGFSVIELLLLIIAIAITIEVSSVLINDYGLNESLVYGLAVPFVLIFFYVIFFAWTLTYESNNQILNFIILLIFNIFMLSILIILPIYYLHNYLILVVNLILFLPYTVALFDKFKSITYIITDREKMLEAIKNDGGYELQYADDTLKADREVVLEAVREFGYALNDADDTLKADREVVLEAVKNDGSALQYADDTLKADREVVLEAVKNDCRALLYTNDSLRADREVVLEAVKNYGLALQWASKELKKDPELKKIAKG